MRDARMAKHMETSSDAPRQLGRTVAALLAVLLAVSTLAVAPPAGAQGGDVVDWLSKVNGVRSSRGLAPLQLDGNLSSLAQGWSEHMARQGSLSHTPNLGDGVTANWTKLGENVGLGGNSDIILNAFLNSPAHYANLTDPAFTHIGIGVAYASGLQFVTHRFMATAGGAPPPPPPAPAPAPPPAPRPVAPPSTSAPAPPPTTPPVVEAAPEPVVTPPPAEPGRVAAVLDALRGASD
jgi:uncharacterized protein YkwD